jgi:hypothetical protein
MRPGGQGKGCLERLVLVQMKRLALDEDIAHVLGISVDERSIDCLLTLRRVIVQISMSKY